MIQNRQVNLRRLIAKAPMHVAIPAHPQQLSDTAGIFAVCLHAIADRAAFT
jgi:hypothetical protein